MNHHLWKTAGARVLAMAFLIAGAAACGDRISNTASRTPKPLEPSPSAIVIGQAPAEPQPEGTETTAPAATTEMSKSVESTAMPLPGQPNDHSNVAPKPSQSAESIEVLKSPEAAKQANNGEKQERVQ